MIQSVHNVLVGKKVNLIANADSLVEGDVALFDQNKKAITAITKDVTSIYIGVAGKKIKVTMPDGTVADKVNIEFSNEIQRCAKPEFTHSVHAEPVEESVSITLPSEEGSIVPGHRYVIRILYKDIEAGAMQFTHTYEVTAATAVAADLASAFAKKIAAHKNRRINVGVADSVITLTAMAKDDSEGVNSINEYSVISMEVSLYETIPGALLSNQPKAVEGAVITKSATSTPGMGYWKQVRDAEVRNMGYKGHVFTGAFPAVEQTLKTVADTQYDCIIIENDNLYLSNDNQYIKTTPITTEVFVPSAATLATALKATDFACENMHAGNAA